jgi:RNA polymerase sigma-54 factor
MPSQTLSLAQTQRLQMMLAPQLRQSLEMLQVPILELRAMIQQEIEQNPTIEETPNEKESIEIEPGTGEVNEKENSEEMDFEKEFEALAKLDDEWRDYFFQDAQATSYSSDDDEKRQFYLDSLSQSQSLQEHLMEQFHLAGLEEADEQLGELIIGSIDGDGYLTSSLEELADSTGADLERLADMLSIVQDFHPTGVGSRDLRECLLTQLHRVNGSNTLTSDIISSHIDLLAAKKYTDIAKALKVPVEEVQTAANIIGTLDPKPGRIYSDEETTYILPEIVVQKIDGHYVVILNDDQLPHVRISNHYRKLMNDASTKPEVKQYIQERIRAGAFLIKSIHQRQHTIQRIATEIVRAQQEFFEHGVSQLKPLTMAEIAEKVGVHETTVSRAVSGKYMKSPGGVYELKYFFTPGIRRADGSKISNKTVKDIIAQLVSNEDPAKPLSDQEIMEKLKAQGITIARRTIAKYRLMLRIPPSHLRKTY